MNTLKVNGFAMVEVLVSLLILSIGVLGMAALQLAALKFNRDSYERSQATLLLYDYTERMRVNKAQAAAGAYTLSKTSAPSSPSPDCSAASCSAAQMAAYDSYSWLQLVKNNLPAGYAVVSCQDAVCTAASQYRISVYWQEQTHSNVASSGCASGAVTDFSCVSTFFQP